MLNRKYVKINPKELNDTEVILSFSRLPELFLRVAGSVIIHIVI